MMSNYELEIYDKTHVGVVTAVKYILDDSGNPTTAFSGFFSAKLLFTAASIDWVRWCNPLMSQNGGYGLVTVPVVGDVVLIEYDITGRAYARGMMLYSQVIKPIFTTSDYGQTNATGGKETSDKRLNIQPGEILLRGKNGSSIHFRNDGSTVFMLDDTVDESKTLVIKADSQGNVSILNAGNIIANSSTLQATCSGDVTVKCQDATVTCDKNADLKCEDAKIEATSVEVVSDSITLGKTGVAAPIIRNTDMPQHVDPILGIPVVAIEYLSSSESTEAK